MQLLHAYICGKSKIMHSLSTYVTKGKLCIDQLVVCYSATWRSHEN